MGVRAAGIVDFDFAEIIQEEFKTSLKSLGLAVEPIAAPSRYQHTIAEAVKNAPADDGRRGAALCAGSCWMLLKNAEDVAAQSFDSEGAKRAASTIPLLQTIRSIDPESFLI